MKEFSIESIIPQNRCLVGYCRHYRYRQVPHNPTEKKKHGIITINNMRVLFTNVQKI